MERLASVSALFTPLDPSPAVGNAFFSGPFAQEPTKQKRDRPLSDRVFTFSPPHKMPSRWPVCVPR